MYKKTMIVVTVTIAALLSAHLNCLNNANAQNDVASAQGSGGIQNSNPCTSPQGQEGMLIIDTVLQDPGQFVKVPVNNLTFGIVLLANGSLRTSPLGLSNPISVCLNPGHFTVTETAVPSGYTFGPTIYTMRGAAINRSTNAPCSADLSAGKVIICTITNTVTGTSTMPVAGTNVTVANVTTLSVSGSASMTANPDMVTLLLGVQSTNGTANGAILANSNLMNKVINTLKSLGVRDNETSTSSFSVSPNYSQAPGTRGNITGFTATNVLTLSSFNVGNASKWIDASIKAGSNSINGIDFRLSDKKLTQIKNTLIDNAIDDAIIKAKTTASKLGQRVLAIKSVVIDQFQPDLTSASRVIQAQGLSTSGPASGAIRSPLLAGEQQITQKVGVVLALGR